MTQPLAPHEEQQFHFLLFAAIERYSERLEQRCGGPTAALHRLMTDPEGDGIWLTQFADAIFKDFLLDNVAGACFILQALSSQPAVDFQPGESLGEQLRAMALATFSRTLKAKTEESLERSAVFEPDPFAVVRDGA